jgi:release factor glutamine methyltransferase
VTGSTGSEVERASRLLEASGVDSPRHDAEVLLAWVLGTTRSSALAVATLDETHLARFRLAVDRRAGRAPLQHITGTAAFRYLELEVGPGVFVPRPETEVMTGVAVDELRRLVERGHPAPLAVDLCSGSGAVALAMATEAPGARVTAAEVSEEAFAYARRNADRFAPSADIRLGDIETAVDDLVGRVSVVTANPPYIPLDAYESVAAEAREHDPPVALWSGDDGLDTVRLVSRVAARLLVPGGLVLCEHADSQGESAPRVFAGSGLWGAVRDNLDLAGRPRFVSARRVATGARAPGTMSS